MPVIIDGTNGITQAGEFNSDSSFGFKNRIINGAMVIDQRNAGASVTGNDNVFPVDRYKVQVTQSSKFTMQQNAGSVTPPAGFTNYLGITSSSAYSVTSSDYFFLQQRIEGYNVADLDFGKSTAKTITLSFWVRSSLTGTFGGSFQNDAQDRNYPFAYTISVANTWEYKTITATGDTTGTWLTTNGNGLRVNFGLGVGANFSGTAGAWNANSNNLSSTGATSVVGTNGATFYITGVQLEVGSTATSFDYRPYGTELALCQRYFTRVGEGFTGWCVSSTTIWLGGSVNQTMRTAPTVALISTTPSIQTTASPFTATSSAITTSTIGATGISMQLNGFSGMTADKPCISNNTSPIFSCSSEL